MKTEKVEKYGKEVFSNVEMDKLRKTECLCLNCGDMKDCLTAKALYYVCKNSDVAMMITRCPLFKDIAC